MILAVVLIASGVELPADVVIIRDPPFAHSARTMALVGSRRFAEKAGVKVGEALAVQEGPLAAEVVSKSIEALGGGGTVLFRRGRYHIGRLVLPVPSYFTLKGEQRRCSTAELTGTICFSQCSDKNLLRHTFLVIENLHVRAPAGAKCAIRSSAANVIMRGIYTTAAGSGKDKKAKSHIILKGPDFGLKILENPVWLSGGSGICWDLRPKFVSVIDPECFNAPVGVKFGGGGLYMAGHLGVGNSSLVGISTYPLDDAKERNCYPTSVLAGAPEGPGAAYRADGAVLLLVGCRLTGRIEEVNGGKVIKVGNE